MNSRDDIPTRVVVDLYKSGLSAPSIARQLGCSVQMVYVRLDASGVPRRRPNAGRAAKIDMDTAIASFHRGVSITQIARNQGCDRSTMRKWLKRWGCSRSAVEAAVIRHRSMTPKERQENVASAHDAVRGTTKPEEVVRRMVKAQAGRVKSQLEQRFFDELRACGIIAAPGYQVERFLVDLALVPMKVAVEVDGGNWHTTKKKQEQDRRKTARLRALGWEVIRVRESDLGRLKEILARFDLPGGAPSVEGEERVLGSHRDPL